MSAVFSYKGYLIPDAELDTVVEKLGKSVVDMVKEEWAATLKAAKETILNSVLNRLGTAESYRNIMLGRALPKLQNVFNPQWPGYERAIRRFRAKQAKPETFQKFYANFTAALSEGGIFDTRVDSGAETFASNVRIVLRTVGVKQLKLGPARKLHMILIGDMKVQSYFDPALDSFTGKIDYYVDPALPKQVAQAVIPVIVETIVYAEYLNAAGLTSERDAMLSQGSTKLKTLLAKILDASKVNVDAGTVTIGYDAEKDNYYVEVSLPAPGA